MGAYQVVAPMGVVRYLARCVLIAAAIATLVATGLADAVYTQAPTTVPPALSQTVTMSDAEIGGDDGSHTELVAAHTRPHVVVSAVENWLPTAPSDRSSVAWYLLAFAALAFAAVRPVSRRVDRARCPSHRSPGVPRHRGPPLLSMR